MADIPYTVAKKAIVLVPPLSVPYGVFKTLTTNPEFETLVGALQTLLESANSGLNKDNHIIKNMVEVYNNNANKSEYDKFADILTKTILAHAPATITGGKRRYTRKKRHNKRKTRKRRKQRVKQRITRRHKS
jgi:hypothetical protein